MLPTNSTISQKYTQSLNTYVQQVKPDWKDRIEVEIGDIMTPAKFLPQTKIKRWDNEVNVSLRLIHTEKSPTVSVEGDKIKWKGRKIEAHFYDINNAEHPEGAEEFEVVLLEKPKNNVVQFTVVDIQ
jgi:hypothetical protein